MGRPKVNGYKILSLFVLFCLCSLVLACPPHVYRIRHEMKIEVVGPDGKPAANAVVSIKYHHLPEKAELSPNLEKERVFSNYTYLTGKTDASGVLKCFADYSVLTPAGKVKRVYWVWANRDGLQSSKHRQTLRVAAGPKPKLFKKEHKILLDKTVLR